MKQSLLMSILALSLCATAPQANAQTINCVSGASISSNNFCILLQWNGNAPSTTTLQSTTLSYAVNGTNKTFAYQSGIGTGADPAIFKTTQGGSGSCNANATTLNSLAGQSIQFLLNGVTTNCFVVSPLPIVLSSFNARLAGTSAVQVSWTTEMEKNVNYFSVQRSIDGSNWKEIAKSKPAAVASDLTQNYSYTDNLSSELSGQVYYRLVTVDYNESMSFSDVSIVKISGGSQATTKVYPTVTNGKINISTAAADATIVLTDLMGAKLQVAALNNGQIDIQQLPAGMYLLNILSKQGNESFKIVKQ